MTQIEQVQAFPLTILEDTTLSDAADLSLLDTTCTMRAAECRAMHGKVMLKGEAAVTCLALQPDGGVRVLTSSTPFTQILELPDTEEGDTVRAAIAVREIDCRLEADGLLSYTISASALLTLRRSRMITQIEDLYLPGQTLQCEQKQLTLHSMGAPVSFSLEVSETVPTAQRASHIISAQAVCCAAGCTADGLLQCTAAVQVLYMNEEQQLCALQRTLPLSAELQPAGEVEQIDLRVRAGAAGEQGIVLTFSVVGQRYTAETLLLRQITDLQIEEETRQKDAATLLARYIIGTQPLWDIAKDCGTTVDAIRQANELAPDAESASDTILLIPIRH